MLLNPKIPLLDMLLPRRCLVCKVDLAQEILCDDCDLLCKVCPNPLFGKSAKIYGSLFYYEFTIQEIIRRAKFDKSISDAHLLLALVRRELFRSELWPQILAFEPCAITYIPAHWGKRLTHSLHLPLLFAQLIGRAAGIPVISALKKNKYNFTQSSIARKSRRREEIKGVFSPADGDKVYKKLLLVDDIVTTGATFDETRKMLHRLGSKLRCVAMAKTP